MKIITLHIAFLLIIISVLQLKAQTNPNLYDIPTAENVLLNIKGKDNIDTYAKQRAALYVLWDIAMSEMEKDYMFTDKPIKKVIADQKQEYNEAMRMVYEKYLKEINQAENQEVKDKWHKLWADYKFHTPNFKEDLIAKLFNERAKNRYYDVTGKKKPISSSTINVEITNNNLGLDENDKLLKAEATYQIGIDLLSGDNVEQSFEKALLFFKDAADLGNQKANFFIGYMHSKGWGVEQNYDIAKNYYKLAEKNKSEYAKAMYSLAILYYLGKGIKQDFKLAYGLSSKASGLDNLDADVLLGIMNYKGLYVPVNDNNAFNYFKKAADKNNANGQYYTGWMYINEKVVGGSSKALPYYLALLNGGIRTLDKEKRIYVHTKIMEIYIAQNKKDEALNFIKFVRENNLNDIDYDFIKLGLSLYLSSENNSSAFQLLKEYNTLKPNNAVVLYNMGVLASQENKHTEAINYYKEALIINPLYEDANMNIAAIILNNLDAEIVEEMNSLGNSSQDDIKHKELKKKREDLLKMAIPYLLRVLEANGESKLSAINTLINVYNILGDTENETKMKKLLN